MNTRAENTTRQKEDCHLQQCWYFFFLFPKIKVRKEKEWGWNKRDLKKKKGKSSRVSDASKDFLGVPAKFQVASTIERKYMCVHVCVVCVHMRVCVCAKLFFDVKGYNCLCYTSVVISHNYCFL